MDVRFRSIVPGHGPGSDLSMESAFDMNSNNSSAKAADLVIMISSLCPLIHIGFKSTPRFFLDLLPGVSLHV